MAETEKQRERESEELVWEHMPEDVRQKQEFAGDLTKRWATEKVRIPLFLEFRKELIKARPIKTPRR